MATPTASKVFGITELAEEIFTYLDIDDILAIHNVNHHFRNLVNDFSKIQRKIALAPDLSPSIWHPLGMTLAKRRLNDTRPGYLDLYPFRFCLATIIQRIVHGRSNSNIGFMYPTSYFQR